MAKNLILWLIIAAVLVTVMNNFSSPSEPQTLNYSDFIQQVKDGKVERVTVDGYVITGKRSDGDTFKTIRPAIQDNGLIGDLVNNNVVVEGKQPEQQSIWTQLLVASFPILVIIAVFMFFMRQMQGGGGGRGGPMSFGKSKARLLSEDQVKTTFADVAGCDEAKEEVSELVEFLLLDLQQLVAGTRAIAIALGHLHVGIVEMFFQPTLAGFGAGHGIPLRAPPVGGGSITWTKTGVK